jgi:glycosyltransferase involved in cell wall biosynthesis
MLAPFPANLHRPLDPVQKQSVRERYAEGRDYFLASLDGAEVADLVALLLAFAVFKKRQRSNMALILINVPRSILEDFAEKKDSYRHREDLKWLTVHAPVDRSELLASAYTLLLPSSGGNPLLTLAAFSGRVPVISASVPRQDSFWEASVLHSNLRDPEDLAGQMIALYKDESIRTKLINRGDEERKRCNPEQSCSQFLELIGEVLRLPAEMTIHGKFAGKT